MNDKPDFICLGAPRAGTTWLYECLNEHPGVFLPLKEVHFFIKVHGRDYYTEKGLSWYLSLFKPARENQISGDIAAGYLRSDVAFERIQRTLPNAKLIVMLRNPVDRMWSDYQYSLGNKSYKGSFDSYLASERGRRALEDGQYGRQIDKWLEGFPDKNFHFVFLDDVRVDTEKEIYRICDFLGIQRRVSPISKKHVNPPKKIRSKIVSGFYHRLSDYVLVNELVWIRWLARVSGLRNLYFLINQTKYETSMIEENHKRRMVNYYADDIARLEVLTNRDLSEWLK